MKRSAFEKHAMNKFTTANPNRISIGALATSVDANVPQMMEGMETAIQLQQEAREIKQWLIDHPTASQDAISEQRRRLKQVLSQIAGTVKQ